MPTPVITISKRTADADGVDPIVISGIPTGSGLTVLYVDSGDELYRVDDLGDTSVNLTFNEAGDYEAIVFVPTYEHDDGRVLGGGNTFSYLLEAI